MKETIFTVAKGPHKAFLFNSIFMKDGREKAFPVTKIDKASDVGRKIREAITEIKNEQGEVVGGQFTDGDIDFTFDEAAFLKEELTERFKTEITPSEYQVKKEIEAILN